MKLPRDLGGETLAQALVAEFGYRRVHQSGSHIIVQTEIPSHHRLAVPAHAVLRVGTLSAILRAVGAVQRLEKSELIARLTKRL